MLRKIRKYESEQKIIERFLKYRKGKKIRKDCLHDASRKPGQKKLSSFNS